MFDSIALSLLLALVTAGCALVRYRWRRRRDASRRLLRDLSPVSGEWLTDHQRSR
jgi:hypothetical protein